MLQQKATEEGRTFRLADLLTILIAGSVLSLAVLLAAFPASAQEGENPVYDDPQGSTHGMMTGNHVLYGLSDGGAHCGTICDGSFPTTTIALWSRGNKAGLNAPLEQLIHGYTQRNALEADRPLAAFYRGVLAPGYLADLNVIALDELALAPPEIVQDLPAGGTRLLQQPRGYRWTVKSGVQTFANGEWTGRTPGRLLRGERVAA